MRVNVYAEEMTDRLEIIAKEIEGQQFTGLRFYLELPATVGGVNHRGPFMHGPDDDDSSAVTFWGKHDLRVVMRQALVLLDEHYDGEGAQRQDRARRLAVTLVDEEWGPCDCGPGDDDEPCECGWAVKVEAVGTLLMETAAAGLGGKGNDDG